MKKPIPVNRPLLSGNEKKYINECIDTGWISSEGPFVSRFEEMFAQYIGAKHGIAVANGSGALDIAFQALGIGPGDEIIAPTFTIISPIQSIIRTGATPILIDSDPETWNMDVRLIEEKITSRTKAILVVHIYGLPVEMQPILKICKRHNLKLIEDAAEMHGQTCNNRMCGSFGDISTFSFYPNKHITTGEGGMCLTNDDELAEKCKKLRNLAFETKGRRFVHHELGWNYRMTNMQAAIGLAQLENINRHIEIKRELGQRYRQQLQDVPDITLPPSQTKYATNIYWVFGLMPISEQQTQTLTEFLHKNSVGTRPFFWCMHEQPVFNKMGLFLGEKHPHAEKMARQGIYVPSGLGTTADEVDLVVHLIKEYYMR